MAKQLVVFFDSGDTLIDESTEVRNDQGIVVKAGLHEGSKEMLLKLMEAGCLLALVADGEVASFHNMYLQHGLQDIFKARAVSEALGDRKPAAIMFQTAMDQLGLKDEDKFRVVMIGNNLPRDILGANQFGIRSILYDWSSRYNMQAASAAEEPDYRVHTAGELTELLLRLQEELPD